MSTSTPPPQDLVPTTIAIFSDVEVAPSMQTPVKKPAHLDESIQTSGYSGGCSVSKTLGSLTPFTEGGVRTGRVHAEVAALQDELLCERQR
eukprot:2668063-Amphidinium_carterae.1